MYEKISNQDLVIHVHVHVLKERGQYTKAEV